MKIWQKFSLFYAQIAHNNTKHVQYHCKTFTESGFMFAFNPNRSRFTGKTGSPIDGRLNWEW